MREKIRRIMALVMVIVLVGMYVFTIIAALMDNPATMNILLVSIGLTVVLPIILYVLGIFARGGQEDTLTRALRDHAPDEKYDRNSTNIPHEEVETEETEDSSAD